ncbi:hypothetical protein FHT80_000012 [Rhizobium sp. BK226]|uniref:hypothetical protein n=1 Tax=Rhizobium TaxID=379 RepID=UPI0016133C8B|nr:MULTISPECIES: hypothetical protein [Rhizobium]MBB3297372.1 hypothetical protein [Rhizobium sp. BK112]MBB3368533.1 hypothetical protein [Rhizobium sp. BK077]MBB4110709.1 hypothetical protein [Rhizobium sp. BK226]MBB4177265.1 hypothetical protein [Rhizobium sp. BK109]UTS89540.1 hypothetical protein NE851_23385 [Rhizobium anhuiense bv. trifolii]
MDKESFDMLFNERVAGRLARLGFVSKGKTLYFETKHFTIALVRLGGRMSASGAISHILCFRHSFLRDRTEQIPRKFPTEVFDYPYKFKPLEDAGKELVYRPQNLNYDYERLHWESADERSVCQKLDRIADHIENRFLPWAKTLTSATARLELMQFGEKAWCEQMWIADYAARSEAE